MRYTRRFRIQYSLPWLLQIRKKWLKPPFRRVLDKYVFKRRSHIKDPGYAEYLAVIKRLENVGTDANIVYVRRHIKPQFVVGSLSKKATRWCCRHAGHWSTSEKQECGRWCWYHWCRSGEELAELYLESYASPNSSTTTTSTNTGKLKLGPSFTSPGLLRSMGSLRVRSEEPVRTQLTSRFGIDPVEVEVGDI